MSAVESPGPFNPLAIVQAVTRNIVPVIGIVAFGWPAIQILLLYFIDTLLAMGVMFAGLASTLGRQSEDGVAARINGEAGAILAAIFLCALIAVPLGMPLVFVGAYIGWDGFRALWTDHTFLAGVAWQAAAAIWSYAGLWHALRVRTPEELGIKRRFALVFLRWIVVLLVVYSPIAALAGRFLPHLLVVVYAAASTFIEIAPDRFLRLMPGAAADADPAPGAASKGSTESAAARRRRRRHR